MIILDKYTIILDELDFALELINIKNIKHINITIAMYIVFTRIHELFPKEISNIIILEYEKIINNIIANESDISDDNPNNEYQNFIHTIRASFFNNSFDIQDISDHKYFIFHDKQTNTNSIKLPYNSLRSILSIIIQKEIIFFKSLKELYQ